MARSFADRYPAYMHQDTARALLAESRLSTVEPDMTILAFPKPDSYQRAEWRRQEEADALDARTEEIHFEIKARVLIGLSGNRTVKVPYALYGANGTARTATESVAEAVHDALNHAHLMELFMKLMESCTDPAAAELRVALAEQIAKDRATGLAEISTFAP